MTTRPKAAPRPDRMPCGRPASAPHGAARPRWAAVLEKHLADKGLKRSAPRLKVAELILSSGGHLDAHRD